MSFNIAAATNIGTRKNVNQDNYLIKTAKTSFGDVCIAVMCDGMGGLADGEVASMKAVSALNQWFLTRFASILQSGCCDEQTLGTEMDTILSAVNAELVDYGNSKGAHVGTTATILILAGGKYYVFHVGDSRCYKSGIDCFSQITDDDSLAAQRMRNGEITPEEFLTSREKHILVQCIGVNPNMSVRKYTGDYAAGDSFLLCCDGLYNKLTADELRDAIEMQKKSDAQNMESAIESLITTVISRGETDNITGLLINAV